MEETQSKQHVQVPNKMADEKLEPKDQLVYMFIKSFDHNGTCFPSLQKLAEVSGASIPTIRKCIDRLKETGYIEVKKVGRKQYYYFNDYKKFEVFSPEFLKSDFTLSTKAYLVASQQYMIKDVEGIGKISMSNYQLAKAINSSEANIRKCNKEIERANCLTILKNSTKDLETGLPTETKVFNLQKLGQAIIWTLKDHSERLDEHDEDIAALKDEVKSLTKLVHKLLDEREKEPANFTM